MKIQGIHFRNHKVLKNLKIDFTYNGKVRDLTVIAGANGSGKTNILRYIYDYFNGGYRDKSIEGSVEINYEKEEKKLSDKLGRNFLNILGSFEWYKTQKIMPEDCLEIEKNLKILPKVIYIPTEINFQNITTQTNMLK
ncbi:MAG: AAA family ATPase, partial [Fusobacterium mortiferum]